MEMLMVLRVVSWMMQGSIMLSWAKSTGNGYNWTNKTVRCIPFDAPTAQSLTSCGVYCH